MPRSSLITRLLVALLVGVALWYVWMIASAKLEWGGSSPEQHWLGTVPGVQTRAVSQYCTGVLVTPQGTWLVGRLEDAYEPFQPSAAMVDLNAVLHGKAPAPPKEPGAFGSLIPSRERETTFISRLDANGQFTPVAHLSGAACLVASPDGAHLYLLSDANRPDDAAAQTVVFRSDDQGQHWTWMAAGFFPEADRVADNLTPYFYNKDEVWAWGSPGTADDEASADPSGAIPTGVYYSRDGGAHSAPVVAPQSLLVPREYAQGKRPDIVEWRTAEGESGDVRSHVLQQDAQHAMIWVSQRFWGSHPDGQSNNLAIDITTRASLTRTTGGWQVGRLEREDGLFVTALADNGDGRVIGLIDRGGYGHTVVAELNTTTLAWQPLSDLPSVFSPLAADTQARGLWVGRNSLLLNTSSEHHPPRWLYWWGDANISAEAVFYSKDWGQSWQRLAVDGYMGVRGFDGGSDRVFWSQQKSADDTGIGSYSLH
ncbi:MULTISPECIES: hypothetical protein [Pseudomonas]|mgnify:FL=1|jgi:hypothetical protein|uniref:Uncharacterized protein n=2 Tax=Pseudomonas TaxID=286 RepID=A0A7M2JEH8_PSEFL|nr:MULTISPECIES: hypothetical protein [Pseudomonas]AHC35028.1 hypothetical protein U771_12515 [Pseudomonas sp. TKP]MBL1305874.1 hypothetical protein [Pseudomonas sp.]PMX15325.1 hypothetical protein C1Y23_28930 [Pseudomonas sp. GW460-12]PMX32824.1 hypothetical protein C1Y24_19745 [Pseudomonas sp. MPR-R2A4]PMX39927.1 hypothetical protein C1Y26_16425 [Pseudomonas sp. MPR-R2A7]